MARPREIEAMRLAIVLSAYGLGTTSPNPPVGCVILKDGEVVGTGFHERKGEPHAEAIALRAAGEQAYGATALVTLEPCNHVGRTPACRQALLDAGVRRVVIAVMDPTSRGVGGAAVLRANGVDVEVGVLADEARLVLGPWLTALEIGRPTVTAAYSHDEAMPGGLDELATELRPPFDLLIREDGRLVEEGVPKGHGIDAFHLPPASAIGKPNDTLRAVHVGGARTVLLIGRALAAGVCGLTTAICLAEAGLTLRVWAAEPPQATTSGAAGAMWGPYLVEPVDGYGSGATRHSKCYGGSLVSPAQACDSPQALRLHAGRSICRTGATGSMGSGRANLMNCQPTS